MKSGTELCDEEMREDVAFVPYDEHKARSKSKSLCHKVSLCHKREGWLMFLRVGVSTHFISKFQTDPFGGLHPSWPEPNRPKAKGRLATSSKTQLRRREAVSVSGDHDVPGARLPSVDGRPASPPSAAPPERSGGGVSLESLGPPSCRPPADALNGRRRRVRLGHILHGRLLVRRR